LQKFNILLELLDLVLVEGVHLQGQIPGSIQCICTSFQEDHLLLQLLYLPLVFLKLFDSGLVAAL
jgi:hypothetical protein